MKVTFDKFYTNDDVARICVNNIDLSPYDLIIEPSAGGGSFSKLLNCISYDIEPTSDGIIKQDFLTLEKPKCKNLLIIGNPPFGERSKLAKAFIKKSIEIGASTIAFILPNTFNKLSNQKIFPVNWKLLKILPLNRDSFNINGTLYHVPCSFFVWSRTLEGLDLREKEITDFRDFEFLPRLSKEANFVLNGNSGKVRNPDMVTNPKSEHYIKGTEEVRNTLSSIPWEFNSSVNGGVAWIGKQDIIKQYLNFLSENKR